jgi:hypothetical protein
MPHRFVFVATAFVMVGCNTMSVVPTKTENSKLAPDSVIVAQSVPVINGQLDFMPDSFCNELLDDTPEAILKAVDHDLDAVAAGRFPCGNFAENFVQHLENATAAGAASYEINARVDRLISLAEKGIFLSTFERYLFKEKGSRALREYAVGRIFENQTQ